MPTTNAPSLSELFEAKPKTSMAEQVFEQLRELIDSGKLVAGYVFPNENEMCQQMHIGRSTLREAYEKLRLAGYITRTKRGTSVNDRKTILESMPLRAAVEESSAEEFQEFRYALELCTAELAASHGSEEDLSELAQVQEKLAQARDKVDVEAMTHLDKAFHVGIATATHNQLFIVTMIAVTAEWNRQVARNFQHAVEQDQVVLDLMLSDHASILEALRSHDGERAKQAMEHHIGNVSF